MVKLAGLWLRAPRRTYVAATLLIGFMGMANFASAQTVLNSQNFDANNYSSMLHLTEGCTHTWMSSAGYRGGAAKLTPPLTNEGGCELWAFDFANLANKPEQVNVRFLLWHGPTWFENGPPRNKLIILNRDGNRGRPMVITQKYTESSQPYETFSNCDGIACIFEDGGGYSRGTDTLRIGNPPNAREQQWICVELEANSRTGVIRLYVDTQDSQLSGLYIERPMDDSGPGGTWSFGSIGAYMERAVRSDPGSYIMIDELVVANGRIGPPEGFNDNTRPRQATNVAVQ